MMLPIRNPMRDAKFIFQSFLSRLSDFSFLRRCFASVRHKNKSGWCTIQSPENVEAGKNYFLKIPKRKEGNEGKFLLLFCICRVCLHCMRVESRWREKKRKENEVLECPKVQSSWVKGKRRRKCGNAWRHAKRLPHNKQQFIASRAQPLVNLIKPKRFSRRVSSSQNCLQSRKSSSH